MPYAEKLADAKAYLQARGLKYDRSRLNSKEGSRVLNQFSDKASAARRIAVRGFEAAAINRLTASWVASAASIDRELRSDLDGMRRRSREMGRNNEYAKKFFRMVRNNVVGPAGFTLQARVVDGPGKPDSVANTALEASFYRWAKKGVCEVTGRYGFVDACRLLMTAMPRDGEYLVRKIRGAAAGNAWGFAFQILDIDRLDTQMNRAQAPGVNAIVMGVEIDTYSRPVAYHLFKAHPDGLVNAGRERERVPADEILHGFLPDELEQTRGIPWMHAAMRRLHDLGGYREAAIIAARIGAAKMGVWVAPDGNGQELADGTDAQGNLTQDAEPGEFRVAPNGYDFKTFDPTYPHAQFDMFNKACLRGIAAGFGVSYNGLATDLEGVNFSSMRGGVLEERDEWMVLQGWFTESFLIPIYEEWLRMALLMGAVKMPNGSALPLAKYEKFAEHQWQGRRWQWVDPLKDAQAASLMIKEGLATRRDIVAQSGGDLDDIIAQLQAEKDLAAAHGVSFGMREAFDTYGVAVRAGVITPQPDDEQALRQQAGLPPMSQSVKQRWEEQGGYREPITLQVEQVPAAPEPSPTDDDEE